MSSVYESKKLCLKIECYKNSINYLTKLGDDQ